MNGFEGLVSDMFSRFDPDIRITAVEGKNFYIDTSAFDSVRGLADVAVFSPVIEEAALVRYEGRQAPATIMGVDTCFASLVNTDSLVVNGAYHLNVPDYPEHVLIGYGLAAQLSSGGDASKPLEIYAPLRSVKRISTVRPDESLTQQMTLITGIFNAQQEKYDNSYILASYDMVRQLFEFDSCQVTSVHLSLRDAKRTKVVEEQIKQLLGADFRVQNRYEQQEDYFRILQIEKWLTFLLLGFILLIAVFNIVGTLSMLLIDKRNDIQILRSLGAQVSDVQRIFLYEGWMVSLLGAVLGIVLGLIVCLLQQQFGLITLGNGADYAVRAYPVQVQLFDLFAIFALVSFLGFIMAWLPVMKKNNLFILVGVLLLGFTACTDEPEVAADPVFTDGFAVYYGNYYKDKGIAADVWGLELFTEGVTRTESGSYKGTGRLITFTDIFADNYKFTPIERQTGVPGKMLAGTYSIDTTYQALTMIAGQRQAGYDLGAYVATLVDGSTTAITYFDKGSITISHTSLADSTRQVDSTYITFNLHRPGYAQRFRASYAGRMPIYSSVQ